MNILRKIKAEQIALAEKQGESNPYLNAQPPAAAISKASKMDVIKAKQLEKDPDFYATKEAETPLLDAVKANQFEQLQAVMLTDIARIKTHKQLADKQATKVQLLPNYLPFVLNYMEQGHDYPCDVAVQTMVWLFDSGDIETALKVGLYLSKLGNQPMPQAFKCDIPSFMARSVYEWANEQLKNDQTASPYLEQWIKAVVDNHWDLCDALSSQNIVMLAKHAFRDEQFKECIELCLLAERDNPEKAGVKTLLKKAQAKIDGEQTNK